MSTEVYVARLGNAGVLQDTWALAVNIPVQTTLGALPVHSNVSAKMMPSVTQQRANVSVGWDGQARTATWSVNQEDMALTAASTVPVMPTPPVTDSRGAASVVLGAMAATVSWCVHLAFTACTVPVSASANIVLRVTPARASVTVLQASQVPHVTLSAQKEHLDLGVKRSASVGPTNVVGTPESACVPLASWGRSVPGSVVLEGMVPSVNKSVSATMVPPVILLLASAPVPLAGLAPSVRREMCCLTLTLTTVTELTFLWKTAEHSSLWIAAKCPFISS